MTLTNTIDTALVERTRVELAAVFRIAAKFGWHESVGNHFSAAVSDDGTQFLMNPRWRHFDLIRASELQLLDANDSSVMNGPNPPDVTAWCIHGTVHAAVPSARVLLHVHSDYATALAGLADPTIYPIDQNTARFHDRVAYDLNFGGMADDAAEAQRLGGVMADKPILLMGNHGVAVAAPSVAEAFEDLYYFERACKTMILAYATQQPLSILTDEIARKVTTSWEAFNGMGPAHLHQQMELLDRDDPSYRD